MTCLRMQSPTTEPLTLVGLARSVWRDFWRARTALFIYDILFKLLEAWVVLPLVALVLALLLSRAGHIAVTNRDLLDFFLSPSGLLYAALFSTVAVALLLLEQAGIMILVALAGPGERAPVKRLLAALRHTFRIAHLGALKVALLALTFVPFVLLALLTYALFLSQYDLNYYLQDRPPVFWLAAGIGALLGLAALATGMVLYVRWAFALPIVLFEKQFARAALRASRERVRGVGWRVGFILLGWPLGALLLGGALLAGFRLLAASLLANAGERPIVLILLLLFAEGGLLATLAFGTAIGQGLLTRRLYLLRSEQLGLVPPGGLELASGEEKPSSSSRWLLALLWLPFLVVTPLVLWTNLSRYVKERSLVQVTAHRGHSLAAPENTLSAVRKAIESGADYAEVDVQQTADGVIVLLHDRDLKRVAGDSRRLEDLPYNEVQKLDVGSWFDRAFKDECVPTLAEVIKLARGRIKLNIELKFFGPDRRLARAVARLVREQRFESECLVTSFDYDALQEAKRENPRLRTGIIVGKALGDVSRLEVEVLSVWADALSDKMLRAAHRRGMEVHVWTVNDARRMARLIKRGVDNVITDDPDLAIRVRDEWASLTGTGRLVVASRLLLGLDP